MTDHKGAAASSPAVKSSKILKTRALVLRKTKLKEKDLILTLLAEDGSQLRAVAHGAQRPGNAFAARLELFSVADVMLHAGRSLYTVSEARAVAGNEACRADIEHLSHASVAAELIVKTTFEGQEVPVLFRLTQAGLASIGRVRAELLPLCTAAFLVKAMAYLGFRPSFDSCVMCGAPAGIGGGVGGAGVAPGVFSIAAGGWVCGECAEFGFVSEDDAVDAATAAWIAALMGLTFAQIEALDEKMTARTGPAVAFPGDASREADAPGDAPRGLGDGDEPAMKALGARLLGFCGRWAREHLGVRLKTLEYLAQF